MSYGTGSMRGLSRGLTLLLTAALTASLAACGGSKTEQAAAPPAAPPADAAQQVAADAGAPAPLQASGMTWTPEQLEALAAPIALYPDPVLAQVFMAASNPQEVLDAGNWLLANESLTGKALDEAATQVGFTPPVRGLLQFPQVIDLMCMQLDWTTDLGQAFVDDQAGLLDAVQRLRTQAVDVGNLQSSPQMTVETEVQEGKEVITVSPPSPEVVYVPQYDPVAVYAPPAAAPAAATTTTTTTEKSGHSTGAMVTTGLLSFGAGLLVAEIFDDDDDYYHHNKNYYPNYGYGGMPYYPPYPYRPSYGNGFYPGNGYNRPPGYGGGNNTVIVNQDNNYWNSYNRPGNNRPGATTTRAKVPQSPITTAKKNRPELNTLNAEAKKGPKRKPPAQPADWKGQSGYAGAKNKEANARVAANKPGTPTRPATKTAPKVQGSYAGAGDRAKPAARPASKPAAKPAARPAPAKPAASGARDRGHVTPAAKPASRPTQQNIPKPAAKPAAKPAQRPAQQPASRPTAVSGANKQGGNAKAASQRGKQSMPKGVPPKAKAQKGGKQKAGR